MIWFTRYNIIMYDITYIMNKLYKISSQVDVHVYVLLYVHKV